MALGIYARGKLGPDGLSNRERGILNILECCAAHGDPLPTLKKLGGAFARSPSWASTALGNIQLAGFINLHGRGPWRAIEFARNGARLQYDPYGKTVPAGSGILMEDW